jgi:hypothetical protein
MTDTWHPFSDAPSIPTFRYVTVDTTPPSGVAAVDWLITTGGDLWTVSILAPYILTPEPAPWSPPGNLRTASTVGSQFMLCVDNAGQLWQRKGPQNWGQVLPSQDPLAPQTPALDAFDRGGGDKWVILRNGEFWIHSAVGPVQFEWEAQDTPVPLRKLVYSPHTTWLWALPMDESQGLWWKVGLNGTWTGGSSSPAGAIRDIAIDRRGGAGTLWIVAADGGVWTTTDGSNLARMPGENFVSVAPSRRTFAGPSAEPNYQAKGIKNDGTRWSLIRTP